MINLENHRLVALVAEFRAAKSMDEVVSDVGHYDPRLAQHGSQWALRNFSNVCDVVSFLTLEDAQEFCGLLWPGRPIQMPK